MIKDLESGNYEDYDSMVEALREAGVEDSTIKANIGNKYRDQYKDAYLKGDYDRMAEIEELLDNTGFDFDLDAWEEQANKKYGK
jgi:O-methyltransferase involved in polyketide biosynthesis